MSTEIVFIKTGKEEINHNPFRVNLADRRDGQSLNRAMDIASIKLHNVNLDIIDEVSIYIGGSKILSFEGKEINNIVLPNEGILLSKCMYHNVDIFINFNKSYIRDNSEVVIENEYETEEVKTDRIVYVKNPETGKVYPTSEFELIRKPTGRNIEVVRSYPTLEIPDVEIGLKPAFESIDKWIITPVWQKYLVTPDVDTWEFIKSLIDRFQLKTNTEVSVEELYKRGKPFYGKIRNEIKYISGMAGLAYGF
jgi:hypothetical protein